MKKIFMLLLVSTFLINENYGDGIKTKLCQSASSVRNPSQGATLSVDGVFYNPAGSAFLKDGIHFSINNQTISQKGLLKTNMSGLNINEFSQKLANPVFPGIYAVYKHKKLAFSLGFYPVDGFGKTICNDGLTSFEMQIKSVINDYNEFFVRNAPIEIYSFDSYFEKNSRFYGFQGTTAYKATDKIAFSVGLRYVSAKNSYSGYSRNVMIDIGESNMTDASDYFYAAGNQALGNLGTLQSLITGGAGNFTLAQAMSAGYITSSQRAILEAGLSGVYSPAQIASLNVNQVYDAYEEMGSNLLSYSSELSDKQIDVVQTGSGIAPIFGFTFKPTEKLVFGLKYELKTKMKLKNERYKDNSGLFSNTIIRNDMPSMLTLGISYEVIPQLSLSGTTMFYFDKSADYGKKINNAFVENTRVIDKNIFELALGTEFSLTEKLLFSVGYVYSKSGVNAKFQDELDFYLTSNSLCGGIKYDFSQKTSLNLGFMNSWFQLAERQYTNPTYKLTFEQSKFIIALGIDIMI